MKLQIRILELKQQRLQSNCTIRSFSVISGLSSPTIQKIEKGDYVNLSKINSYLNGLTTLNGRTYIFVHEQKKE